MCSRLLNPPAKGLIVTSDLVNVIPGSIVGAYVDKQKGVMVQRMDALWQSVCDVLNSGFRQAVHLPSPTNLGNTLVLLSPAEGSHKLPPLFLSLSVQWSLSPVLGALHFMLYRLLTTLPHACRCLLLCLFLSRSTAECLKVVVNFSLLLFNPGSLPSIFR